MSKVQSANQDGIPFFNHSIVAHNSNPKKTGSSSGGSTARVGRGRQSNACVLTQQPAKTGEASTFGYFLLFVLRQVYRPKVRVRALAPAPPWFKDNVAYLCAAASWMSAVVTEACSPAEATVPVFKPTLC